MKSAETVEEREIGWRHSQLGIRLRRQARHKRRRQRLFNAMALDLIFKRTAFSNNHHARDGVQQYAICFRDLIRAPQVNAAGFILKSLESAGPNRVVQLLVQQLKVVGRRVVKNYEIDLE